MKIFISYRRNDSARDIGRIRDRLKAAFGEQSVFRDLVDIPGGVDFRTSLEKETNECKVMLVIIGPQWASITGKNGNKRLFEPNDYTRMEVETGLRRLKDKEVTVFPILILNAQMPSQAEIPESIADLTYQNAINIRDDPDFDHDIGRLIRDIRSSQGFREDDIEIADYEPKTIYIEEGSFLMGTRKEDLSVLIEKFGGHEERYKNEIQQHKIMLPAYRIGKFPVRNKEFEVYVRQKRISVPEKMGWDGQKIRQGEEDHPVTGVTWIEAVDYCRWLSDRTGRDYSLPNEAQWEKACRGTGNSIYPWGDEFDPLRCNHGRSRVAGVKNYLEQNDYGCYDFVGNVRQWTCSLWGTDENAPDPKYAYPWSDDGRNNANESRLIWRVVRGSSFKDELALLRCTARYGDVPTSRGYPGCRYSFRVAMKQ